jgi:pimeloyl-ACP methyl ester carboxylesterase
VNELFGAYGPGYRRFAAYWDDNVNPADVPGVLFFHGGGLVGGNIREHNGGAGPGETPDDNAFAQFFAVHGFYAVSVGYTITPPPYTGKPLHPIPVTDIHAAFDFFEGHCDRVVGVIGNSVGAFVAASLRAPVQKVLIAAPLPLCALPWNPRSEAESVVIDQRFAEYFGTEDRWLWDSPKVGAETLAIHGAKDTTVPVRVARELRAAGIVVKILKDAGHAPHRDFRFRNAVWHLSLEHVLAGL